MGLNRFSVLLIGAGSLGTAIVKVLCGLEPKVIGVVDGDIVEKKNLLNQHIYTEDDAKGTINKSKACVKHVSLSCKKTRFVSYPFYATDDNIDRLIRNYDIVIDATDGIQSRSVINSACIRKNKPLLVVSAKTDRGLFYVITGKNACFNCIIRNSNLIDNSCASISTMLANTLAILASSELLSYVGKKNGNMPLYEFSLKSNDIEKYYIRKDPMCEVCGTSNPQRLDQYSGLIHACSGTIKFSFKKKANIRKIKRFFGGKSIIINDCLLLKNGNKSLLISKFGDVLMHGYDDKSARVVLLRISSVI